MESEGQTINLGLQKYCQNPEDQEIRCRICYDLSRPLISVCDCSGSIAFVHEDCILDWITKKIETSERVEIPSCEICHQKYSARMKVGKKKLCFRILMEKIKSLDKQEIIGSISIFICFIISCIILALFAKQLLTGNYFGKGLFSLMQQVFLRGVSQYFIMVAANKHIKKRKKLANDSIVQIVEVTLMPKVALKK